MILQSGWSNFNTSHVNVNPDLPVMGGERRIISIHLMLMLIYVPLIIVVILFLHFNTSHVNVNLNPIVVEPMDNSYFNTSHVNVNLSAYLTDSRYALFQYISC